MQLTYSVAYLSLSSVHQADTTAAGSAFVSDFVSLHTTAGVAAGANDESYVFVVRLSGSTSVIDMFCNFGSRRSSSVPSFLTTVYPVRTIVGPSVAVAAAPAYGFETSPKPAASRDCVVYSGIPDKPCSPYGVHT